MAIPTGFHAELKGICLCDSSLLDRVTTADVVVVRCRGCKRPWVEVRFTYTSDEQADVDASVAQAER